MANVRLQRMESLLREEISSLILRDEIKDPRVDSMLSVSNVSVSKDLVYAKVRVSGFKERNQLEEAVNGLNNAAGFIQRRLGRVLHSRHTPRLTFLADHSIEEGFEINQSLGELTPGT
jgi:ribosome-binding factor A